VNLLLNISFRHAKAEGFINQRPKKIVAVRVDSVASTRNFLLPFKNLKNKILNREGEKA